MKLYKYTKEHVIKEGRMYLDGTSIPKIAMTLKMPQSTVSWHLINPLRDFDYKTWIMVRQRLHCRAKDPARAYQESEEIGLYLKQQEE